MQARGLPCLFQSHTFSEVQNRHIQLIGIGGRSRSSPSMTTELLKALSIQL